MEAEMAVIMEEAAINGLTQLPSLSDYSWALFYLFLHYYFLNLKTCPMKMLLFLRVPSAWQFGGLLKTCLSLRHLCYLSFYFRCHTDWIEMLQCQFMAAIPSFYLSESLC